MSHIPVLLKEVLEVFEPIAGKKIIDATANGGGHTRALREAGAEVLAIEWDPELAKLTGAVNANYADIAKISREHGFDPCDGVLFDLGFSSWHIEESGKGFSFQKDELLDMRYGGEGETARDILNTRSEEEIAKILKEYGEEKFDGRIASAIVRHRPIMTTRQLVEVIENVIPRRGKINPATRTFQALRIAVNHELENLQKGLEGAREISNTIAVITFHSLEDRIVKQFFKKSKIIRPSWAEIKQNRRAHSAKLHYMSF